MASRMIEAGQCFGFHGEKAAFQGTDVAALYRGHYAELIAFLRRRLRHGSPEPEDIAQLTFARLMAWGGSDIVNARSFLFAVAKRLIVDHHRRQISRDNGVIREVNADRDEITPETVMSDREQLGAFLRALGGLSAVQREAIVLSRIEGLGYNEVAAALGISSSSVQKHVERGLAKCRRQIDRAVPPASAPLALQGQGSRAAPGQARRKAQNDGRRRRNFISGRNSPGSMPLTVHA